MNYGKLLGQYERTRVDSAGREELVVICYEKAIQFLGQAKNHYADREFERKGVALNKAIGIINELQSSLNFEGGGEIAANLDRIYSYASRRLLLADHIGDMSIFDEVIRILAELKTAWDLIASNSAGVSSRETAAGLRNGLPARAAAIAAA